jgi:hypothetical protein
MPSYEAAQPGHDVRLWFKSNNARAKGGKCHSTIPQVSTHVEYQVAGHDHRAIKLAQAALISRAPVHDQ